MAQSLFDHRLIVSFMLPFLPVHSALAEVIGTRVQLGHFGIPGEAHDYTPPFQHGAWNRSYANGSTSATAGPGTLSIAGRYTSPANIPGTHYLRLNSYFADTMTIDAPGRTGQQGSFTVSYIFDGSYDANGYFNNKVSINCNFGTDAGDGTIPDMSSANNNGIANGFTYRGDDTYGFAFGFTMFLGQEQTATLAFTYGQPFDFWLRLGAQLTTYADTPGDTKLAISLVKWSGIQNIMAGGTAVADATTSSVSGTNWTQSVSSLAPTTNQTRIAQVLLTPTSIILSGTNGAANGPYRILSSSNLSLTSGQWPAIYSSRYDSSGKFDSTNSITPTDAQRFYLVQ